MTDFNTLKVSAVAVYAVLLAGVLVPMRAIPVTAVLQQSETMAVTAGQLADHPDRYFGKRVTLTGEVEDVYSRSVFSIDEDKLWSTGQDVLVLNPNALGPANQDGTVTVQGVVRPFSQTEIDRYIVQHGWQWDLATVYHTRFSTRPIVIADSIMTSSNRELVSGGASIRSSAGDYGQPTSRKSAPRPAPVMYTTPEDLSQHPERFYGKTVSIIGTPEDTFGTQLFSIDEDRLWSTGEDVLVLASGVASTWEDLPYVQVRGTVMRFARAEVQKRLDKNRTIADRFWEDFDDRPVLMAESVKGPEGKELMKRVDYQR